MKAIKYWGVSLGLLILVSCTKSEMQSAAELTADNATVTSVGDLKWSSVANAGAGNEAVAFAGEIKNDAITEEVMESGLVLVFSKTANQVQSLPFQEETADLRYWYYHVSQGSVFIQANSASKSAIVTTAQDFAVVVISKSQLETLETNGTSRDLLLGMSLDQLNTLLK
jgi:hypothetical protein